MKKQHIVKLLGIIGRPVCKHPLFFGFMYILGAICIEYTTDRVYMPFFIKLFFELFLDLYVLAALLSLLPRKAGNVLSAVIALLLYVTAIVDMFCFVRISSTLSPSITRLIAETNTEEATGFMNAYISPEIIWSPVGFIILLAFAHLILSVALRKRPMRLSVSATCIVGLFSIPLLLTGMLSAVKNKSYLYHTWQQDSVGQIEKYFGDNFFASRAQYLPVYRLFFSLHANRLAAGEASHLLDISKQVSVSHCSFTTPTLVLIIGESYNKHHSQLYGYPLPTTPEQEKRQAAGELFVFEDAVTPFNITSDVLKNAFSLNDLSEHENWSDKPLFTQLFKKVGYDVTFLSNFFVMKEQKDFADFSGGMFLNDASLSATQFHRRNATTHQYDEQLFSDYELLQKEGRQSQESTAKPYRLIIFSLTGQHVDYHDRYPAEYAYFKPSDYHRSDLTSEQLQVVADYDNATRYNDYIVDRIIRLFEHDKALVIYMADHGEEVYDEIKSFGRQHNIVIPHDMAKNEFQVPFWIWASASFREQHPELTNQMQAAVTRPFFSDDLSQLMLYLGGIQCADYRDSLNILSPNYTSHRLRLLRGKDNYDHIIRQP